MSATFWQQRRRKARRKADELERKAKIEKAKQAQRLADTEANEEALRAELEAKAVKAKTRKGKAKGGDK